MAVLLSKDKKELVVTCDCGCMESFYMKVYEDRETDPGYYSYLSFMKSDDESESYGGWQVFKTKIMKIWCILRGKDYFYSDTIMSEADFEEFKNYINQF